MDRSWGHSTKWNKEHRERQMLYDLPYKQNSFKKLIYTENRLMVGEMDEEGQKV